MKIAKEEVNVAADPVVSSSVVGDCLARTLVIWKSTRRVQVRQENGYVLEDNLVINTFFKVVNAFSVLGKFAINAEVLNIGNRDVILGLYWWMENVFAVDTQDLCLRNIKTGQVIPFSAKCIPSVSIMEEELVEDSEI